MLLCGGDDRSSRRVEEDDDDDNFYLNAAGENASSMDTQDISSHPFQTDPSPVGHQKKWNIIKITVPSMKHSQANKEVSLSSVSERDDVQAENSSSIRATNEVSGVFMTANISSSDNEVLVPSEDQRANKCSLKKKFKSTTQATNKRQKSSSRGSQQLLSALSHTDVPVPKDLLCSSEDSIPPKELSHKEKEDESANSLAPVNDDPAQPRALLCMLEMSKTWEEMNVHYKKIEMGMQTLTSELESKNSQVEELEQKLKISESERVKAENKASFYKQALKRLVDTLDKFKSDMDQNRDQIGKDAIDAFRSSQEFLDICENIKKETINSYKSTEEFLGSLNQIRTDAIEKFKLSDEFLELNDKIRTQAIKKFKESEEYFEIRERTKKDAIKEFKSSENYLNSLARIRKVAVDSFKSSNEFFDFRDDTRKKAIETFRTSAEFYSEVQEKSAKHFATGFEACQFQLLDSGKLPEGFNFDFLNVNAGMFAKPPEQVHHRTKAPYNRLRSIKPER